MFFAVFTYMNNHMHSAPQSIKEENREERRITHLGKPESKGSQWLEKWKKRFAIKQLKICGESGEVQGETVDSWKERLPEIVQGC